MNADSALLHAWEASLSPLKVDIVGDFVGKELFAVHGEALLSYCVTQAGVDYSDGFQLLHAVHAFEVFMSKLKERGCNFHVLWFDSHQELAIPPHTPKENRHKYLLTRAVLIEHLRSPKPGNEAEPSGMSKHDNTNGAISFSFPAVGSAEFASYLDKFYLHFVLCSRGTSLDSDPEHDTGRIHHILFMHLFAQRRICLAFIDGVEYRSSKVYARIVTPSAVAANLDALEPHTQPIPDLNCVQFSEKLQSQGHRLSRRQADIDATAREEIALVACASVLAAEPSAANKRRVAAFLVHVALLQHVELAHRSCAKVAGKIREIDDEKFLEDFSNVAITLIRRWTNSDEGKSNNWRVCDLVDGRLFMQVLHNLESVIPIVDVRDYGDIIQDLVGLDVLHHLPLGGLPSKEEAGQQSANSVLKNKALLQHQHPVSSSVLPFSHPVLEKYLEDIKLATDPHWKSQSAGSKIFQELSHWHNAKKRIDPKHGTVHKPMNTWALKRNQRFMADTIAYSASLTNASGKNIKPETIIVQEPCKSGRGKPKAGSAKTREWRVTLAEKQAAKPVNNSSGGRQQAHDMARSLKATKDETRSRAVSQAFADRCKGFDKERSLVKRFLKASKYLNSLQDLDREAIGGEASLYVCNVLAQIIVGQPVNNNKTPSIIAMLRAQVLEMHALPLTADARKQVECLTAALQLPKDLPRHFVNTKRHPALRLSLEKSAEALRLPTDTLEFQLQHCGPYLERSFDSASDPRVPFQPDAWQRKVLDAIDADKSLFVVAPTSAGKTFISFYAMKKVLQANDDDILVYVAPTKALVNQIAAEVQARFSKTYGHNGRSVWAIHTRDYRINNPAGCQVLVTVPHILQIMLLAPSNAQTPNSWSRKVKRIIFDEVHCIGQAEDGIIWEQLLLLAPCPIIALSATVGNPLEFKEWLAGTQKAKGFDLEMVVHSARYSDLRKFIYQPPRHQKFQGFEPVERLPIPGLDAADAVSDRFVFVHPVGSIINNNKDSLNDLSLDPRDCLQLWKAMVDKSDDEHKVDPSLSPHKALPEMIKKSDVVEWEAALKEELYKWMSDTRSPFARVQNELRVSAETTGSPKETVDSTFSLLTDLRSCGALPAIVFNYDRVGCEEMLSAVMKTLKEGENRYRESSPEWAKKMEEYRKWETAQMFEKQAKAPKASYTKRGDKDDGTAFDKMDFIREDANQEASPWASFDPNAPIDIFSFAEYSKFSHAELEEMIVSLKYADVGKPFIDALRRGLGVHHAGMNRKYRQSVEMLFRKGFLTAVIATGTLALGLNMPCKTVAFAGDSVFLTALNYRQASGRAGRRGFDLLGNVVFHGIPQHRAMEIMSSRLPDLRGQFPMSVTLVLRLFGLLHGTNGSEYAVKAVESLLTQTRLYLGGPSSQMSIKHHLRFSIEYLRRQHLLSAEGAPLNFSGLVGHLYFTENAIFAFHSLLKEGYLHELCDDINNPSKQKDVLLELVKVLCHLFCRIPCHRFSNKEWLSEVVHRSPSIVLLPRLPERAEQILRDHNNETLDIFQTYVRTFVNQHLDKTPDDELPFTKRRVGPDREARIDIRASGLPILPPTTIRSPFAALSGFTDDFATVHELCTTVRAGVFLEESAIPYIPIYPDETGGVPFNAYILDFFKHGSMETLKNDNRIKSGDVWFHLKDFSLVLATIVTSLANFLDKSGAGSDDAAMIDVQDAGDVLHEEAGLGKEDEQMGAGPGTVDDNPAVAIPQVEPKVKKAKSKRIVDSWEDELSGDEDEEFSDSEDVSVSAKNSKEPAEESSTSTPASWDDDHDGKGLVKVFKAFKLVQQDFDEKFRKVWA